MKKSIFFIIPGIIIGLVAGIIVFKNISNRIPSNPPELIGNTAGNLNSGGLFCESDGVIYFANPYDKNKLYSMNSDCSDIRCISDDSVRYINVAGQYIYYIRDNASFNDDAAAFKGDLYGLARCKLDGTELDTLVAEYCTDLSISGNTLVYDMNRNSRFVTCTVDIKGDNSKIIHNYNISNASVFNGSLFYSDDIISHSIYNMDLTNGLSSLYMTGNTDMSNYVDGILYYLDLDNNNALTALDVSSNKKTVITDKPCALYNVYGNSIFYYIEDEDTQAFYRASLDGSDPVHIMYGQVDTIGCTSDYTYFQMDGSTTLFRVPTYGDINVQTIFIQPQE